LESVGRSQVFKLQEGNQILIFSSSSSLQVTGQHTVLETMGGKFIVLAYITNSIHTCPSKHYCH
jgi:hypothetical protein